MGEQHLEPPASDRERSALGRYRQNPLLRWWSTALASGAIVIGLLQVIWDDNTAGFLVMAGAWCLMAVLSWLPEAVITRAGVRFSLERTIQWSAVRDVGPSPVTEWKPERPRLLLRNGKSRPLPQLTEGQVEQLRELVRVSASNGSEPAPPG